MTSTLETEEFDFSDVDEGVSAVTVSTSRTRSASSAPRRGRRPVKRLTELQKRLSGEMFQAGAIIGMGLPVTGYYVSQESSNFTQAIVDLAAKRAEWLEALEHVADIGPGITIGRTVLGMGVALGVDRQRIDPDKAIARFLGVTTAFDAVYPEGRNYDAGSYVPPPAGSFVPVS